MTTPPASPHRDLAAALLVAVLAGAVFATSLGGEFVYDDVKQIAGNHLIQEPGSLGRALLSDVWAFKGERAEAWSNYWRPVFVLWLAAGVRLWGLEETLGWHLGNVLLHALASVLAFWLLRRLGVGWTAALVVAGLFAVHPVHVESVAWISGVPDLLVAVPLLAALGLVAGPGGRGRQAAALGLAGVAMLAKEVGVMAPLLVALVVFTADPGHAGEARPAGQRLRAAARAAWPFALLAGVYLAARHAVLGQWQIATPWHLDPGSLLLSAPSVLCFYLRQALLPVWLGPSYPLRAVTWDHLGWLNFGLPLAVLAVAALLAVRLGRGRPLVPLGLGLFLLPLLPAFNLNAFIEEQLVHDRYLYLPLLGLLTALVPPALARIPRPSVALAAALAVALPLAAQTVVYNRAWASELALWQRGVRTDPTSAFNHAQLGNALLRANRLPEARAALERALTLAPVTTALLDLASLDRREGRHAEAETALRRVLAEQPDNPQAYEQLALVYQAQGRLAEAVELLRQGRERVPYQRCAMSSNLAVLLYLAGQKAQAQAELEAARPRAGQEPTPACHLVLFHLGSLYLEQGRKAEARQAFEGYLQVTTHARDAESRSRRERAEEILGALGGAGE